MHRTQEIIEYLIEQLKIKKAGAQTRTALYFNCTRQYVSLLLKLNKNEILKHFPQKPIVCKVCQTSTEIYKLKKCKQCFDLKLKRCKKHNLIHDKHRCAKCNSEYVSQYIKKIKSTNNEKYTKWRNACSAAIKRWNAKNKEFYKDWQKEKYSKIKQDPIEYEKFLLYQRLNRYPNRQIINLVGNTETFKSVSIKNLERILEGKFNTVKIRTGKSIEYILYNKDAISPVNTFASFLAGTPITGKAIHVW